MRGKEKKRVHEERKRTKRKWCEIKRENRNGNGARRNEKERMQEERKKSEWKWCKKKGKAKGIRGNNGNGARGKRNGNGVS